MLKSLLNTLDISASGLSAQRTKMNVISENIANAETTRTEDGNPYRRQVTMLKSGVRGQEFETIYKNTVLDIKQTQSNHIPTKPFSEPNKSDRAGVHVADIAKDMSPFKMVFDPNHPDADEDGYVAMPNVNIVREMTELIAASRAFEANITALRSSEQMIRKSLTI